MTKKLMTAARAMYVVIACVIIAAMSAGGCTGAKKAAADADAATAAADAETAAPAEKPAAELMMEILTEYVEALEALLQEMLAEEAGDNDPETIVQIYIRIIDKTMKLAELEEDERFADLDDADLDLEISAKLETRVNKAIAEIERIVMEAMEADEDVVSGAVRCKMMEMVYGIPCDPSSYASEQKNPFENDCASDGFVRFQDPKSKKVGMRRGDDIVVPAEYRYLSQARNGMIIAQTDTDKKDERGRTIRKVILIDTLNNVLIEEDMGMKSDSTLNFATVEKTETPHPDTALRVSFPAKEGGFYSFVDSEKELRQFFAELMSDLTPEKLAAKSMDSILCFMNPQDGEPVTFNWKSGKKDFTGMAFNAIKGAMEEFSNPDKNIRVTSGMDLSVILDSVIQDDGEEPRYVFAEEFRAFMDGICWRWQYPVFTIVISDKKERDGDRHSTRSDFGFVRTDNGYKLYSVSIRSNDLFILSATQKGVAAHFTEVDADAALYFAEKSRRNDDTDVTLAFYDLARRLSPDTSELYGLFNNRSILYADLGKYNEAIADLEAAMKLGLADEEDVRRLHYNRGLVHMYRGNDKAAAADFAKLGDKIDSTYNISIRYYNNLLKRQPDNAIAHFHRGMVYAGLKDYEKSAADLKEALRLDPKHAQAKRRLAEVNKNLNKAGKK